MMTDMYKSSQGGPYELVQNMDAKRIYHACEDIIEKPVPRIIVWHHEACRVMTNGDSEGRIFLSHIYTKNGFFFLLTIEFLF